jgi:hypothetical protein
MDRLGRVENKIDRIIDIQTQVQIDVAEHMRRTLIAEENIEKLADKMEPIQKHIAFIDVLGKLIAVAAAIATIAGGIAVLK